MLEAYEKPYFRTSFPLPLPCSQVSLSEDFVLKFVENNRIRGEIAHSKV
jgi:hypothetical protein